MEIDEFRDYEKALGALKEAHKQLKKGRKIDDREHRMNVLESRIAIISDFVEVRHYEKSDPPKMIEMCTSLIQNRDTDSAIRVGDAYALLIEHHFKANNIRNAFVLVQEMRKRQIVLHPYLERGLLEQIYNAAGEQIPSVETETKADLDEDVVREEIGEAYGEKPGPSG